MMIAMLTVAAAMVMMMQAGMDEPRAAYRDCLNRAVASAKGSNVGVDGFRDYVQKTCAAYEDGFKTRLVSFNVKNGMSKKSAADDAELQLEDYVYTAEEKFRYSLQPPQ